MRYVLALVFVGILVCTGTAAAAPPPTAQTPTATAFDGIRTVGPIFRAALPLGHDCTASVIASASHDLVLTAAHCVSGTAAGWSFAPGYDAGRAPYGVWTVSAAFVDHAWKSTQDTRHDFAILRLAHQERNGHTVGVQDVVGANYLGHAPKAGAAILDVAYNAGVGDQPIGCSTHAYVTAGYPSFNCHGYLGGSSGSPWLTRAWWTSSFVVRGVIGGLHQGGCFEYTSYSSHFYLSMYRLLGRASSGRAGDVVPAPGSDGC